MNGPVLISLKPSFLGRNRKKIGRPGPRPKFCISFRTGQGSDLNFDFSFGAGRFFFLYFGPGWAEIVAMRAGPVLKNPARADFQAESILFVALKQSPCIPDTTVGNKWSMPLILNLKLKGPPEPSLF